MRSVGKGRSAHSIQIETGTALLGRFGSVLDCGVSLRHALFRIVRLTQRSSSTARAGRCCVRPLGTAVSGTSADATLWFPRSDGTCSGSDALTLPHSKPARLPRLLADDAFCDCCQSIVSRDVMQLAAAVSSSPCHTPWRGARQVGEHGGEWLHIPTDGEQPSSRQQGNRDGLAAHLNASKRCVNIVAAAASDGDTPQLPQSCIAVRNVLRSRR